MSVSRYPGSFPAALLDTGLRSAAANMDIDRLLLEHQQEGASGDLLRFHRSQPAVCLGRHQIAEAQVREDFCRRHGIEIVRRVSGGGALYLDPEQQGVSLLTRRRQSWGALKYAALLERFGQALKAALAGFGLEADFNFPNDLEIDGRKCASIYLAAAQDTLLFYATLLLDIDVERALCALRAPTEKLSADGLADARARYAPLNPRLGQVRLRRDLTAALATSIAAAFGLELRAAGAAESEALLARIGDAAPMPLQAAAPGSEAVWRTRGGVLRATVACDPANGAVAHAQLAADAQVFPGHVLEQVAAAVLGRTPCMIEGAVHRIFSTCNAEAVGFSFRDVARVIGLALETDAFKRRHHLEEARLMFYDGAEETSAELVLASAGAMLVPYCAKPNWCKWRHRDGCTECGLCEVGEAYRLGRQRNMTVITVTSFEHLRDTLSALKSAGTRAYVGMCCGNFFVKRHAAFQEAGIPALLLDIRGANCYELRQESLAYAGKFEANAQLEGTALRKVMQLVPARDVGLARSEDRG